MVVAKDNMQLAEALLAALKAVQAEGVYSKVMAKWNISPLEIEEPGINLAASKPLPYPEP